MDLDALSGVIAYKHSGEGVMTVTAAVDRITIKNQLTQLCDLQLSGQVTFATGRSSMEISCEVARAPMAGEKVRPDDVLLTCAFTMVSLDPATKKPVNIAPLQIDSPEENDMFDLGERNYEAKKALAKVALGKTAPNDEESDLIHRMWLKQLEYRGWSFSLLPPSVYEVLTGLPQDSSNSTTKPDNVTFMEHTRLHSAQIMQPQVSSSRVVHFSIHQLIDPSTATDITS